MIPVYTSLTDKKPIPSLGLKPRMPDSEVTALEPGPVAFQDASQGLFVKYWGILVKGSQVLLREFDGVAHRADLVILDDPWVVGATHVSLAFDQNGNYAMCVSKGLDTKLKYFLASDYTVLDLPGVYQAQITMDMKYYPSSNDSDILMVYIRDGAIFNRVQRDSFLVERVTPVTSGATEIVTFGLRSDSRMQTTFV